MSKKSITPDIALFLEAGELLYTENWTKLYADGLGVPTERIRDIRRGKANLDRGPVENAVLEEAVTVAEHRVAELQIQLQNAEIALRKLKEWKEDTDAITPGDLAAGLAND